MTADATTDATGDGPTHGSGDPETWRLRMRDLSERTGMPRQAIHFYIQQGLVPPGRKTGRNMAFYGEVHVERLELVRRLQHERFLPLKAIRALLDDRDGDFSGPQRRFLRDVKAHLPEAFHAAMGGGAPGEAPPGDGAEAATEPAAALATRTGASPRDVRRLHEAGLVGGRTADDGALHVARTDAWVVELVAEMRAAGFTEALGFEVEDLAVYEEAVAGLLRWETRLLTSRLADLPPERAAAMVERALPLMQSFLVRHHAARLRQLLDNV